MDLIERDLIARLTEALERWVNDEHNPDCPAYFGDICQCDDSELLAEAQAALDLASRNGTLHLKL